MKKILLVLLVGLVFYSCEKNDEPEYNPYSVFEKEYRTRGNGYEDEYMGHLISYEFLQFDYPKKGDFRRYSQTINEDGENVGGIENVYRVAPTYRQKGQLVIVDYGSQDYDTLTSYGDSIVGKWTTYYYYGSSVPKRISLATDSITTYIGDNSYIDVIDNQTKEHISASCRWLSSDTTIAYVTSGNVYGKKEGNVTITAYYEKDSIKCAVTVRKDSIILPENVYLTEGVSFQLQYSFASQHYRHIDWSSSDEEVVSVSSDGLLYAKKLGSVVVSATAGEYVGTCNVFVNPSTGQANGHEWVDLGLSVLWASMNIGATTASDEGIACAWANPYGSGGYSGDKWCASPSYVEIIHNPDGTNSPILHHAKYSKYVIDDGGYHYPYYKTDTIRTVDEDGYEHIDYQYTFLGDGISKMELQDDAARHLWGAGWRIPSKEEYQELIDNCDFERVSLNGVWGYKVKSRKNGKTIFFPYAKWVSTEGNQGHSYKYWTSDLSVTYYAYMLDVSHETWQGNREIQSENRSCGLAIRGVIDRE